MSELSNKIRLLRGDISAEEAGRRVGLSRESFYRMERGGSVKLATLRQLAQGLAVSESDWLDLLVAWLRQEAGQDAGKLIIDTQAMSPLKDASESQSARALALFNQLNAEDRHQVLLLLQRPELRRSLPALNKLYDTLKKL